MGHPVGGHATVVTPGALGVTGGHDGGRLRAGR